ncbi:MAG: tRNA (adenosine(37)-N6)-dimethylallyltransferase MiaA [Pseudomonadota bacterium]
MAERPQAILIAGPTASGKSALALRLAEAEGGAIINADSQQIYREWRILTARPSAAETARAPHHLYGHQPIAATYSVGHWLREVTEVLQACQARGTLPIIVGGTGLYFKALTEGIAPIPTTPPDIRTRGEAKLAALGLATFAAEFTARDPETAAKTDLANPMRVLRAWEVLETTGRGLAAWQAETPPPLLDLAACRTFAVVPDRAQLYANCRTRFDAMLASGAVDEARTVMAADPPRSAPGLKALGAPELFAHIRGDLTLDEAADAAKQATCRYAKRQLTWVRNQMAGWQRIAPGTSPEG